MLRYAAFITGSDHAALAAISSRHEGLTDREAVDRFVKFGSNAVTHERPSAVVILSRQAKSFFVYLLLVASLINVSIGAKMDAMLLIGFIFVYVFVGFWQEYKAETAIWNLSSYLVKNARVRRNGKVQQIPADQLVPGDIVFLSGGDTVPADLRVLNARGLLVDESILTGESVPVSKHGSPIKEGEVDDDLRTKNLLFFGAAITGGWAEAVVIATGKHSYFSSLFATATSIERPSLFERNIRAIGKLLTGVFVVLALVTLVLKATIGGGIHIDTLLFLVALIVAVVPEALPIVATLAFSKGALALARKHVVVKRLTALEDLGSVDILCTDKTGTITTNHMALTAVESSLGEVEAIRYALMAGLAEKHRGKIHDPFDQALAERVHKLNVSSDACTLTDTIPFDHVRRIHSVLCEMGDQTTVIVRGAPEEVLSRSHTFAGTGGKGHSLSSADRTRLLAWFRSRGEKGERVIAVARRHVPNGVHDLAKLESSELEFIGLLSFADPLKDTSRPALKLLTELGIGLRIITGDATEVTTSIGRELGLLKPDQQAMTGEVFAELDRPGRAKAVEHIHVFARTLPAHKLLIIEALQKHHAVGFLGEGYNDIPALKAADLSLVVERAPDLSRSAADIVLLNEDLLVIAEGVEEGRRIFANTLKYVRTTLAANVGNFFSLAFAAVILPFLPILPVQMLLVNLLSDVPMTTISLDKVPRAEIGRPQKYVFGKLFAFVLVFGAVSSVFDLILFRSFLPYGEGTLQTGWFMFSILTEMVAFISLRSFLPVWKSWPPARGILLVGTGAIAFAAFLVYLPFTQHALHLTPLTGMQITHMLSLLAVYFVANEIVKRIAARRLA